MKNLSIIIVNYNTRDMLRSCLHSIFAKTSRIDFEVIVVDNGSTDGAGEMLATEFPQVKVMRSDYNLGYAAANNRGIRVSSARYVLLLNPDTEVLNGAIQETLHFMDAHPKAGIVGCKLKYPDGRLQPTTYSFPTVWNMFAEATFLYKAFPRTKLFGQYHLSYLDYDQDVQVDWLIGAYFLIRREVIDAIGFLDEQFFMYAEDTDYCYRAKQAGFEVWFTPRGEVSHYYGGFSAINRRVAVWTQQSQILFYQKHFRDVKRYMLVLIKHLGLALRIIWYFTAGIVSVNKNLLDKSGYAVYALYKLLTSRWKYIPNSTGEVTPWEQY